MYSKDNTRLALDFCIFINGLPIINPSFRKWLADMVFSVTYNTEDRSFDGETEM
jgi:hypothetical protein